jgi:hypothetical protein
MYQNQQQKPDPATWQISDGMTVYALDGAKLGTVRNYDPRAGYLDVRKGWLFTKDFYVPLDAVVSVAEDGITLNLSKDELEHERYNTPPAPTEVVYGETFVTEATLPGEQERAAEEEEDTYVMRTADGRPIR